MKRFFFTAGISLFAAMLICEFALPIIAPFFIISSLLIVLTIIVAILFLRKKKYFKRLIVISVFVLIGTGLWTAKLTEYKKIQQQYDQKEIYLTLKIIEEPKITKNGYYLYTAVPVGEDKPFNYAITFVGFTYEGCNVYDTARGLFLLEKPGEEYSEYNRSKNIVLQAKPQNSEEIEFLKNNKKPISNIFYLIKDYASKTLEKFTGKNSGFTKSIILGDTDSLSSEDYESLRRSGLLHIASVSGLHVSILTGIILMLLSSMKGNRLRYLLCFAFLFVLAGVCGFTPSVLRAVYMTGISFIGNFISRKADSLNSLGFAVLSILLFSPFLVISPSFLLSFSATLGMLLLHKPLMKGILTAVFSFFSYVPDIVSYNIISTVVLSLSCTIFTIPVSLFFFKSFSVVGIISNALTMPIINLTFIFCVLILLIAWIPIVSYIAYLMAFIVNWGVVYIMAVTKFLAKFSLSSLDVSSLNLFTEIFIIIFIVGILAFSLLLHSEKKRKNKKKYIKIIIPVFIIVVLIAISVSIQSFLIYSDDVLTLAFIDVGQGDACVITQKDSAIVIDCGGSVMPGERTAAYLRKNGVEKIPFIILSHLHQDHTNGMNYLCENYEIEEIIIPYTEGDPAIYVEITMIAAEEGAKLTVIREDEERLFENTSIKLLTNHFVPTAKDQNENSIAVIVKYNDFKAMLTGDITSKAEKRLIDYGNLLDIDVLGVAHHGSKYSTSDVFLSAASPILSIISVGKNSYGHPDPEVINRLIAYGDVLITKDCGNIEIKTDGYNMDVYKENK